MFFRFESIGVYTTLMWFQIAINSPNMKLMRAWVVECLKTDVTLIWFLIEMNRSSMNIHTLLID